MKHVTKKIISIVLALLSLLALNGCGGKDKCEHLLPSRIEKLSQGGVIPDGSEAKKKAAPSEIELQMLWGTWEIEPQNGISPQYVTENYIELRSLENEKQTQKVQCFPSRLTFSPAWAGVSFETSSYVYGAGGRPTALGNLKQEYQNTSLSSVIGGEAPYHELTEIDDPLGLALESKGYGLGGAEFAALENTPKDADFDYIFQVAMNDTRKIAYTVSGDTLAIGVTEQSGFMGRFDYDEPTPEETNIQEIDYKMEWHGWRLTLTYGKESVTYVPSILNDDGVSLPSAGVVSGYALMDGLYGISLDSENGSSVLMEDRHIGYQDAQLNFSEDGVLSLTMPTGERKEYMFLYSGDALTLKNGIQTSVYSLFNYALESSNNRVSNLLAAGENVRVSVQCPLKRWIESGFTTDCDLRQEVAPCQTSSEFRMQYGDARVVAKVTNPYTSVVALQDCWISFLSVAQPQMGISKADGTQIGSSTYEQVEMLYEAPYRKDESSLCYKANGFSAVTTIDLSSKQLNVSGDVEVTYVFEDGILSEYRFEVPALLYTGMQDNLLYTDLKDMDASVVSGVVEKRDLILGKLQAAFKEQGLSASVDETTGELVLDNELLFATDQYELSAEGRAYLDQVMYVYASVLGEAETANLIRAIQFEGHTDSSGSYEYNLQLSQARAETVMNYCLLNEEINMSRFEDRCISKGFSFSDPVYDTQGREDMNASRRVSIKFFVNMN